MQDFQGFDAEDPRKTVRFAGAPDKQDWLTRMARRSGLEPVEASMIDVPRASDWVDFLVIDLRGNQGGAWLRHVHMRGSAFATASARLCVLVDLDNLDEALALLDGLQPTVLCNPTDSEIISELVLAGLGIDVSRPMGMHDVTRDQETMRLEKLSEEVRRLASTIERLTVSGDPANAAAGGLQDRHTSFHSMLPDMGEIAPQPVARPWERSAPVMAEPVGMNHADIRTIIRARRMRDDYLAADLFADPAWDMLLDLLSARLAGKRVSVSSLCIAAAVPPTTALRWIGQLTERDIFVRLADPLDGRRVFIALTDHAADALLGWADAVRRKGGLLADGMR